MFENLDGGTKGFIHSINLWINLKTRNKIHVRAQFSIVRC